MFGNNTVLNLVKANCQLTVYSLKCLLCDIINMDYHNRVVCSEN